MDNRKQDGIDICKKTETSFLRFSIQKYSSIRRGWSASRILAKFFPISGHFPLCRALTLLTYHGFYRSRKSVRSKVWIIHSKTAKRDSSVSLIPPLRLM